MKNFLLLLVVFLSQFASGQDSLFLGFLKKHTYDFEIKNGVLIGSGADFLNQEYRESQYVLIGEYHGSPQISKFTQVSIQKLDEYGYKTIALEVGRTSINELLNNIGENKSVAQALKEYHEEYSYLNEDNERSTTIPFLDYKGDAAFLNEATLAKWNIYGLDQEYVNSLVPAIDILYKGISSEDRVKYIDLKQIIKDSIRSYEIQDDKGIANLFEKIKKDFVFQQFLEDAAKHEINKEFVSEIRESLNIYSLAYIDRKYYTSFVTRLAHFKKQLHKQMKINQFDLSKDKMLIKFGGLHTAKGTSNYDCLDLGNTFHELATLNQNKSLHLYFRSRFYKSQDGIEDAVDNVKCKYRELIQLGQQHKWIVVDLRPLREKSLFYPYAFNLNEENRRLIINQDILIIPSMDYEGDPLK